MPLAQLHWKRLPDQIIASYDVEDMLNGYFDAMNSSVYYNGDSRTQGVGSAVTVSRDQPGGVTEAVYWSHAGGDPGIKGIIAGRNGAAATAPINHLDTYLSNGIHMGIFEDAGAYDTWDNAPVFTGASNIGFLRYMNTGLTAPFRLRVYESEEGVIVETSRNNGTQNGFVMGVGNLVDPESDQFVDTRDDTYPGITGFFKSHYSSGMVTNVCTSTGSNMFSANSITNGSAWCRWRNKRASSWNARKSIHMAQGNTNSRVRRLSSGRPQFLPIFIEDNVTPYEAIGRLREIHFAPPGQSGEIIESGGVDAAYLIGPEDDDNRERLALRA